MLNPRRRGARRSSALAIGALGIALSAAACGGTTATSGSSPTTAGTPAAASGTPQASAASSALLGTATSPLGAIVVNSQGRTVYMFAADSPGHSTCSGECLEYWPVVPAPAALPASVPGVTAAVGSLARADGTRQLTLGGWPLYTFSGDSAAGQTNGQGKNGSGGLWWVLSPAGKQIKGSPANSSGSPQEQPSETSGGGSGPGAGY